VLSVVRIAEGEDEMIAVFHRILSLMVMVYLLVMEKSGKVRRFQFYKGVQTVLK